MIFKSIFSKTIVIATLLSIGPLSLAGYKIIKIYQEEKREAIIHNQREKANLVSEKTQSFLEKTTETLTLLAQDSGLNKEEFIRSKARLKNHLQTINYLLDIFILDHQGRELLRISKKGISNLKEPYGKEIVRGLSRGKVFYGDFSFISGGIPTLCVAIPVNPLQSHQGYILGARVNLQYLSELIKNIKIGNKGSAYVIDQEGLIIAFQDENAIFWGPFVAQTLSGKEGYVEFRNIRNETFLIIYKTIPNLKWGVITQIPIEEIQGAIAADISETQRGVKTQHNILEQIGINPEVYGFKVIEPLRELYKDEVREVAKALGLPQEVFERIPFPGPGLATRIIGEVTPERIEVVWKTVKIVEKELGPLKPFQAFAVLLNDQATGVAGVEGRRTFGDMIAIRSVESKDATEAEVTEIPWDLLKKIQKRIIDEIPSINKVLYDLTPKPPSTIEYI